MIKYFIQKYNLTPRKLFLIDGIGALMSVFLLGVVLIQINESIGLKISDLRFLSSIPVLFAIYSFTHYFIKVENSILWIRTIGLLNLIYCFVSLLIIIQNKDLLTALGLTYFIAEICIVTLIATMELSVSKHLPIVDKEPKK